MIRIRFIKDYKTCWKKDDEREVQDHFAKTLIDLGYAKRVDKPRKDKMVRWVANKGGGVFTG